MCMIVVELHEIAVGLQWERDEEGTKAFRGVEPPFSRDRIPWFAVATKPGSENINAFGVVDFIAEEEDDCEEDKEGEEDDPENVEEVLEEEDDDDEEEGIECGGGGEELDGIGTAGG